VHRLLCYGESNGRDSGENFTLFNGSDPVSFEAGWKSVLKAFYTAVSESVEGGRLCPGQNP